MPWLDLHEGIVEEFAGAQQRHVNATAIVAAGCADRLARLAAYRAKWRAANQEKCRASNRQMSRRYHQRNREALMAKAKRDYRRRLAMGRLA